MNADDVLFSRIFGVVVGCGTGLGLLRLINSVLRAQASALWQCLLGAWLHPLAGRLLFLSGRSDRAISASPERAKENTPWATARSNAVTPRWWHSSSPPRWD